MNKFGKGNIISIQSHVAYGNVGNSAAVFPMQRLGYNVVDVNTVLYSNHTGYGDWEGEIVSLDTVRNILSGVEKRGIFPYTDLVISGYMGSVDLGTVILDVADSVRVKNREALYICDPVFGDKASGLYVSSEIAEYFRDVAINRSDICTPNLFELEWLTGSKVKDLEDVLNLSRELISKGTKLVLVTSVEHSETLDNTIEMLAVTQDKAWHIVTPKLLIDEGMSGSGDVTASLFGIYYFETKDIGLALEKTANSIYEIFYSTYKTGGRELQIVLSGDRIAQPTNRFKSIVL